MINKIISCKVRYDGKKGETECRFIRCKTYVKHSVLIRSDRKCFEAFKILL